jgi:hypothetical protein
MVSNNIMKTFLIFAGIIALIYFVYKFRKGYNSSPSYTKLELNDLLFKKTESGKYNERLYDKFAMNFSNRKQKTLEKIDKKYYLEVIAKDIKTEKYELLGYLLISFESELNKNGLSNLLDKNEYTVFYLILILKALEEIELLSVFEWWQNILDKYKSNADLNFEEFEIPDEIIKGKINISFNRFLNEKNIDYL